jgi:Leucine-rich repeat (LRR) protein
MSDSEAGSQIENMDGVENDVESMEMEQNSRDGSMLKDSKENVEENNEDPEDIELDEEGNPIRLEDILNRVPQNPLKKEILQKALSKISKTYGKIFLTIDGLSYAYTCLKLEEKELDGIGEDIGNYIHLRDINLSQNKFVQIHPIRHIPYLVNLDASKNEIRDITELFSEEDKLQYLQKCDLNTNKIKELPIMFTTNLLTLNLEANSIKTAINFKGLPNLEVLNLKQNRLKDCQGLSNCEKLRVIYLVIIK